MNVKNLLFILLLCPFFCNAQLSWQALQDAPKSWRLDDFYFLNPSLGWAINPRYTGVTPSQMGRIMKTTDGGATWQVMKDSATAYYRSIGFADALTGWVGKLDAGSAPDTSVLIETRDGGVTWHPANIPFPHPVGICGISVVTDSIIFAYGTFYSAGSYLKTTNKGATWTYTDMSAYTAGMVEGHFFNKDTGFISGKGTDQKSIILYTTNGGNTWQPVYHSTRSDTDIIWKMSFPSRNTGYASVEYVGSNYLSHSSVFLKTTDGGLTWTEHPFVNNYNEEGIGFINDSVGWIGGDNELPNYKTTDGGLTFAPDYSFGVLVPPYQDYNRYLPGFAVNRFRRFGDTLMYASGNTVYKYGKSVNVEVNDVQYDKGLVMNNYPNPFTRKTTIRYRLPYASDKVVLEVHNALGTQVLSKVIGTQAAGDHEFMFNMELTSGTYFYSVSTDKFKATSSMTILR